MINQLTHNQQQFVKKIFTFIQGEKYRNAELEVINVCTKIIHGADNIKDRGSYLLLIDVLYSEFNDYYRLWTEKQSKDVHLGDNSKNFFIEHCNDPIKMEDLLWDAANILTSENKVFV